MSTRMRRGTASRPHNDDDGPSPKSDDNGEDKHQGLTLTKNRTHDTDGRPNAVHHRYFLFSTEIACVASQPPNMRSTYMKTPSV